MLEGILLALLAAVVYGFLGISFEVAGKRHYNVWDVILYKQGFGLLIGLGVWAFGSVAFYNPRLVWLGLIGAASYIAGLAAYLTASRERDIAANWTIVNLSVVIPILVSVVWFHDVFTLLKGDGRCCSRCFPSSPSEAASAASNPAVPAGCATSRSRFSSTAGW